MADRMVLVGPHAIHVGITEKENPECSRRRRIVEFAAVSKSLGVRDNPDRLAQRFSFHQSIQVRTEVPAFMIRIEVMGIEVENISIVSIIGRARIVIMRNYLDDRSYDGKRRPVPMMRRNTT